MDFKALIDFNKYTSALAAASFVYTLEKFVPTPTMVGRLLVLGLLVTFLLSAILGVLIFAASTAALSQEAASRRRVERLIAPLGITHASLLRIGMVALGFMLYPRVMADPQPIAPPQCCCTQVSCTPQK